MGQVIEAADLGLLRVMQAASPIDGDVGCAVVQPRGAVHRAAGADLAELPQLVEHWAVAVAVHPELRGCEGDAHFLRRAIEKAGGYLQR